MAIGKITTVAIQTVIPAKVTEPGSSRRISVAGDLQQEVLGAHFRLLLYYGSAGEEGSALAVAALARETMSVALAEEPMLAGRLRRREENEGGGWEVRFNDAGVRLVQAEAAAEMAEFAAAGGCREEEELGLVYWRDLERENPDQSAMFYVQVTEFKGEGFSIGISCSLLLADPLLVTGFLRKWAKTHRHMTTGRLAAVPMFHLSQFKRSVLPACLAATSHGTLPTTTLLFRLPSPDRIDEVAALAGTSFTFVRSDHGGCVTVEFREDGGTGRRERGSGLQAAWWEELGATEVALWEGNLPVDVSYRIVPGVNQGAVVVAMVPADMSGTLVSVTVVGFRN